jgi:phosphoribosylanthranilate isomerase
MSARLAAKICGIKTPEALYAASRGGAEFVGLMFHGPGPRNLSLPHAAALRAMAPQEIKVVAVVVDAEDAALTRLVAILSPDLFQLHGQETVKRVAEIRALTMRPIIKAVGIARQEDLAAARAFEGVADYLLFDAKPARGAALSGGSGQSFDWKVMAGERFKRPWFLAGGLNAQNVGAAVEASGARLVDVSSGVERARGEKDPALIAGFLDRISGL